LKRNFREEQKENSYLALVDRLGCADLKGVSNNKKKGERKRVDKTGGAKKTAQSNGTVSQGGP